MDVTSNPVAGVFDQFTLTIVFAAPIALLVSLALLRIYRRAVVRSMQQRVTLGATGGFTVTAENRAARSGDPPRTPLEIMPNDAPADGVRLTVRRARWPLVAVEVCAGLAYAIVMTSAYFAAGRFGFEWHVFLWVCTWFAWPMVITLGLAIAVSWRELAILLIGYVLVFTAAYAPLFVSAAKNPVREILALWLWTNGPGTLLTLTFLARPIRAVGSQVLVFMIATVGGAIFVILYFNQNHQALYWVYLGVFILAALLLLACAVATAIICWPALRRLVAGASASHRLANWLNANLAERIRAFTLARPVSAAIAVFMIAAVAGAIVLDDLFWISLEERTLLRTIGDLGVIGNIAMLVLAGIVPTGIVGWLLLRGLGKLYRQRQISDQSIITDAVWIIFSFAQSPSQMGPMSGHSELSFAIAIGAFVAYKLVAASGFRLLRTRAERSEQPPKLLLLRVFSLGTRGESLFSRFTKLWRYIGLVRMIAGPDLATSTVEPHEFLDFIAGRLQRRFIAGPDTLEQRISETEQRRDADGRYRVADFFCHDDTWQMVLRRLDKDSDVVLMDLRGFSQNNRGCVFEINELLNVVLLRHIVFVVDRTTDEHFLTQVFATAWATVTKASPNWNDPAPRIRLYRFDGSVGQDIPELVAVVANAALSDAQ